MKILVLNGSPKKAMAQSYSQVYIEYTQSLFPEHTFETVYISKDIDELVLKKDLYESFVQTLETCDGVIWQMPVYSALVPAQSKQFIEVMVDDKRVVSAFAGKHVSIITTSVKVFDNWAENYLQAVCEHMGAYFTGAFSGIYQTALDDEYRASFKGHLERFFGSIAHHRRPPRRFLPLKEEKRAPLEIPKCESRATKSEMRIGLITDLSGDTGNLAAMIEYFSAVSTAQVDILDLSKTDFKGCRACLGCTEANVCSGKDGFLEAHTQYVMTADAVVYAGAVRDFHLSYRMKNFIDREFYLQHLPIYKYKPVGLLLSGPSSQIPLLQESLDSIWALRAATLNPPINDDNQTDAEIAQNIQWLCQTLQHKMALGVPDPLGYYGASTARIFRDFSFIARFPFVAQYKTFKSSGRFSSFPQKLYAIRFRVFTLQLLSFFKGYAKTLKKYNAARIGGLRKQLLPQITKS